MSQTQSRSTVGPIIFSDETARRQLQDHGEIVTFRKSERTTGDTWWRKSRLGPKEGDVQVEQIEEVDPRNKAELDPYRDLSGFPSTDAWQRAIEQLNEELPRSGILYRVSME